GIVNDYLQDQSLAPLRDAATAPTRLEEALLRFLNAEELLSFETDCVEQMLGTIESSAEERAAIKKVITTARGFLNGKKTREALAAVAFPTLSAWRNFDDEEGPAPRVNRVAWAAHALAKRWPLVATRT